VGTKVSGRDQEDLHNPVVVVVDKVSTVDKVVLSAADREEVDRGVPVGLRVAEAIPAVRFPAR
jgi:hypothetical protein